MLQIAPVKQASPSEGAQLRLIEQHAESVAAATASMAHVLSLRTALAFVIDIACPLAIDAQP